MLFPPPLTLHLILQVLVVFLVVLLSERSDGLADVRGISRYMAAYLLPSFVLLGCGIVFELFCSYTSLGFDVLVQTPLVDLLFGGP